MAITGHVIRPEQAAHRWVGRKILNGASISVYGKAPENFRGFSCVTAARVNRLREVLIVGNLQI